MYLKKCIPDICIIKFHVPLLLRFFFYYIINTSMALPSFRHLCSVSFYKRSGAVVLFRALASLFISLFRCNKVCTCSVNKRRTKSSSFCQRTQECPVKLYKYRLFICEVLDILIIHTIILTLMYLLCISEIPSINQHRLSEYRDQTTSLMKNLLFLKFL